MAPAESRQESPDTSASASGRAEQLGRLAVETMRSRPWLSLSAIAGLVATGVAGAVWLATGDPEPPPRDRLQRALQLVSPDADLQSWRKAGAIAERFQATGYRDPQFSGAVEYILGMLAFREAENLPERDARSQYTRAVRYLREAERHSLLDQYRPQWAYALGISLHRLGAVAEARPRLQEALKISEGHRVEIAMLLMEGALGIGTEEALQDALALNTRLEKHEKNLRTQQRDRVLLLRARLLLELGRHEAAGKALDQVSRATARKQGTRILHARMWMAREKYARALDMLKAVADNPGLDPTFPRRASYLTGVCAEKLGRRDRAIAFYERAAKRYAATPEGVSANIRAGMLLQKAGRDEEALEAFRRALKVIGQPKNFRNRWLTLSEVRQIVLDAWNAWVKRHAYQQAISLAGFMTPLFPEVEARELAARAHRRWAEHLEKQLADAPETNREKQKKRLRRRWRRSGEAYAGLARVLERPSSDHLDALWISAEHYRRGHDFQQALNQITRFLNQQPANRVAAALVRRGKILMDLGRLDDAFGHFRRVIDGYATDSAAFEARYVLGECHRERDELDEAEKTWRRILQSDVLAPSAREWKRALFSLGRLLHNRAALLVDKARQAEAEQAQKLRDRALSQWDEAERRLDEFLARYPQSPKIMEARYLRASALKRGASLRQKRLDESQTNSVRRKLESKIRAALQQANREFRRLRDDLTPREERDRLDGLGRRILRDSYFDIGHTYYALGEYERAIAAYSDAAHRYSRDPNVLLAYLQMSNAYDLLGKPIEARSMIEQARVLIREMPEGVFKKSGTAMNREEWQNWLDWARTFHGFRSTADAAP